MGYNFMECNRDQAYLFPPSLRDWLPKDDLAWFVLDAVEQMDLGEFYAAYREDGRGSWAFDPSMMVSLLVYAYCMGVRSSRQIERMCERDVAFRVVSANRAPDHSTISRFRQEHGKALERLFGQVLTLCAKAGLVKVGVVALDGTKVKASAALEANRTYPHIAAEVKKILKEAAVRDEEEDRLFGTDRRGDELPEEFRDPRKRLERLRECKERLEKEAAAEEARHRERMEARQAEEAASGRRKRGRKPKEPDTRKTSEAKANVTDPHSRIMKTRRGYVQGYNAQALVTKDQVILAAELTAEANDQHQLHPMLDAAATHVKELGLEETIGVVLADAGYCTDENLKNLDPKGPRCLISTRNERKGRKEAAVTCVPRGRIPANLSLRERMSRALLTKAGKTLYRLRGSIVEPVFGQIKDARGIEGFMRRGIEACRQEWKLICATHNILKLWRRGRFAPARASG